MIILQSPYPLFDSVCHHVSSIVLLNCLAFPVRMAGFSSVSSVCVIAFRSVSEVVRHMMDGQLSCACKMQSNCQNAEDTWVVVATCCSYHGTTKGHYSFRFFGTGLLKVAGMVGESSLSENHPGTAQAHLRVRVGNGRQMRKKQQTPHIQTRKTSKNWTAEARTARACSHGRLPLLREAAATESCAPLPFPHVPSEGISWGFSTEPEMMGALWV